SRHCTCRRAPTPRDDARRRSATNGTMARNTGRDHAAAPCAASPPESSGSAARFLRPADRSDVHGIALRALYRGGRHLDHHAVAVLPSAVAALAHRDRDLVRGRARLPVATPIGHRTTPPRAGYLRAAHPSPSRSPAATAATARAPPAAARGGSPA